MNTRFHFRLTICILAAVLHFAKSEAATLNDGFPAWFSAVESDLSKWESSHTLDSSTSYGMSGSTVTALSESGNVLVFKAGRDSGTKGHSNNDLCVGNMGEGDYFLFKVPVHSLSAGSSVDFMSNFTGRGQGTPKYWLFEYYDDGQWKTVEDNYDSVKTLPDGTRYSFYVVDCGKVSYQISTSISSFTLTKAIDDDYILMRVKAVGKVNVAGTPLTPDPKSFLCLSPSPLAGAAVQVYDSSKYPAIKDTRKLGILGNSFTYCYGTAMLLKRVARSQGHQLVIRVNHKGGQTFGQHLGLELSENVWEEGGYDFFLMQDQSNSPAKYADDPVANSDVAADARTLSDKIKQYSPNATIILENTWSYIKPVAQGKYKDLNWMGFGSFEGMDEKLSTGCMMVKDCCPNISGISPIGEGFAVARALYPDFYRESNTGADKSMSVYRKNDNSAKDHHQSYAGAYIKACVNYLTIYGQTDFESTVDNCITDAARAAQLRECAKKAVKTIISVDITD